MWPWGNLLAARWVWPWKAKKEKFHTCGGPRRRPCLGQGRGRRIYWIKHGERPHGGCGIPQHLRDVASPHFQGLMHPLDRLPASWWHDHNTHNFIGSTLVRYSSTSFNFLLSMVVHSPAKNEIFWQVSKIRLNQREFQDPKMEVLYHIRPYFVCIFPGI